MKIKTVESRGWSEGTSKFKADPALHCIGQWRIFTNDTELKLVTVARLRRKAWCLDTHGFIPKKIQWHIHTGPWSLVN